MSPPRSRSAGRAAGLALKDEAFDLFEIHRPIYILRGRRALLLRMLDPLSSGFATIDDVRLAVVLPGGINSKLFGGVPGALAHLGIIRKVGGEQTSRAIAHGGDVKVWALADLAKAEQWLIDNPDVDLPDIPDDPDAAGAGASPPGPSNPGGDGAYKPIPV